MSQSSDPLRILDSMITEAVEAGVGHHVAEDSVLNGRTIRIHGRDLLNFASCSYLGLELNQNVIRGVIDAVTRYGSQFSSSRVFVSAPAYLELEASLSELFGGDTIAAPSTTLGHLAALPVLIGPGDVALLDHHVHNSVQMASNQLAAAGTKVEIVRHHCVEHLEDRIRALTAANRRIWFLIDGVCSMFGDLAPMGELHELLDRHENLHLYVDDAHGMSWCGESGRGYALSEYSLHPRMVVATSLNKAFGAAGGALIFPNAEMRRRVRTCGSTLLFSGPIQPPMLGAALASAKLHLSPEIVKLQARFSDHSAACRQLLNEASLPTCSDPRSPVQFIEVGLPQMAHKMAKRLIDDGFFVNVAQFPAVPMKRAGIRFTLNLHQQQEDLRGLVDSLTTHYGELMSESDSASSAVAVNSPVLLGHIDHVDEPEYRIEREDTIEKFSRSEWNLLLGDRGAFSWDALHLLEGLFRDEPTPQNRWGFHYYRVIDRDGETKLLTFFTDALWKADMLAPSAVSRRIEETRASSPLFLTDRVFAMGCLLSEGNHLYIDPALGSPGDPETRPLLSLLLSEVQHDAARLDCNTIALRDLEDPDFKLEKFLRTEGFAGMPLPDSMELAVHWRDDEEFLAGLTPRSRRHQRRDVTPWNDRYRAEIYSARGRSASEAEIDRFFTLYQNVKAQNLELNTFELPRSLFERVTTDEHWEVVALFPTDGLRKQPDALPVAMGVCFIGADHYVPLIIGLDYRYVRMQGLYRQCMRHVIQRAHSVGHSKVCFGMGAGLEKHRFGATPIRRFLFMQSEDHYSHDVVAQMGVEAMGYDE